MRPLLIGHVVESAKWIGSHNLNITALTAHHKALLKHPAALRTLLVLSLAHQPSEELKRVTISSFVANELLLLPAEDLQQIEDIIFCSQETLLIAANHSQTIEQASFRDAAIFLAIAHEFSSIPLELQNLIALHLTWSPVTEERSVKNINEKRPRLIERGKLTAPYLFSHSDTTGVDNEEKEPSATISKPAASPAAG